MMNSVTQINEAAKTPERLIFEAERDYEKEIVAVAQHIADHDEIKIVSLAGPSASGKTTTAHILYDTLKQLGEKPEVVSLDDFYLPPGREPLDENGKPDWEGVNALDLPLIQECLGEVISTGKTCLPRFDFKTKEQILRDREVDISDHGILIVEGLHALNPLITDLVPRENICKIYISVNCAIEDSFGEQLISSREIRLMRRILRDRIFRNASVNDTLEMWNKVVAGERKNLYCYKNTADFRVKTLHVYEPCIYRDIFMSTLPELREDVPCKDYYMRTWNAVKQFRSLETKYVPDDSLIREFIGNE